MSENTDPPTPKVRVHRNRAKRRFCRTRLPTPPPDPMLCEEMLDQPGSSVDNSPVKDVHFLEYLNSLQSSPSVLHSTRSDSLFAPVLATEDAFDHLDKLYKLMEQMLNLQQQNAKLQKRVRDLEHLKNLQSMHRQVDTAAVFEDIPELDDDSSFAESLLDAMLSGTKKDVKPKSWARSRLRQSLMRRQRNRSSSLNERAATVDLDDVQNQRRASAGSDREKSSKVSKWTKVKAAFRWEKASPSVSGAKSQDSGIGGMLPVNYEVVRYLRVPSTSDEIGISPADSGAADGSTPGTLSSASSADDIHRQERGELHVSDEDRHSITIDDGHITRIAHRGSSHKKSSVKMRNFAPSYNRIHQKHRLSNRSDDTKMDISDNDDTEVFHRETSKSVEKTKAHLVKQSSRSRDKREIPADVVARYQQAIAEDESRSKQSSPHKRISKWTRVKKAFLTPAITSNSLDGKHKIDNGSVGLTLGSHKDTQTHKFGDESKKIQEEIQNNYRQLQKKLSLEFQDKLKEWEKLKASNSSAVSGIHPRTDGAVDDHRDQAFIKKMEEWQRIKSQPSRPGPNIQMIREENLAPEFKKKLEEWQKIKKHVAKDDSIPVTKAKKKLGEWPKWKSVSSHREEHAPAENQPLSDEFLKKLEEWRKIKESHKSYDAKEKTPSPRMARKQTQASSPRHSKKERNHDEKELHWFEKELDKIEKEKQRLEHERQKFLQREERLTKLRRTVMGNGNKKDILIHTPSGFYRFEGISRKFTQKLCEWEQAQGIGPEASTFALLTSNFTPHITVDSYETDSQVPAPQYGPPKIIRSKSAESLAVPNLMQPCPSTTHHPSSLSLNDVEELEKQCLALSRDSSIQDMDGSLEKLQHENDEPEAVIVEVEDVVEETASALEESLQEKHFPVYQREMALNVCEEKSLVVPCIQRVDSKNAQYSYFLIEEIMKVIKAVEEDEGNHEETEPHVLNLGRIDLDDASTHEEVEQQPQSPDLVKLKDSAETQKQRSDTVLERLTRLQEIHSKNISDVAVEGFAHASNHFANLLEAAQDSFSELLQMAEQLQHLLHSRCGESFYEISFQFTDSSYSDVTAITSELVAKLSELKRILTYFYAASDMTAPGRKLKCGKKLKRGQRNVTTVEKINECKNANNPENNDEVEHDQGKLSAKRMRYKKKDYSNQTVYESEDSDMNEQTLDLGEKCPDSANKEKCEEVPIDPDIVEKLVIPTKTNFVNASSKPSPIMEKKPVEVFVKTTRKLFTPVVDLHTKKLSSHSPSCSSVELIDQDYELDVQTKTADEEIYETLPTRLPPLPASPTPQRKASKEISPSIRIMLAKYNQIISGKEAPGTTRSAGSSGSASPVAWRSPVSERRVKAQRERYLEGLRKIGSNSEVKKSASVSVLNSDIKILPVHQSCTATAMTPENNQTINRGILRSTSVGMIQINTKPDLHEKNPSLKLIIPECPEKERHSPEERYNKLKRAKEKFLNSCPTPTAGPSSAPPLFPGDHDNITKYPTRCRFSQISMGSESSYDSSPYEGLLVKSASAGMINVDEDTYKKIDPAFHQDGYVSLPRTVQKQKEGFLGGKLALSNIAAKFRKVRMRRSKDQKKMNTVSALCRQSLVVDINSDSQETLSSDKQARRESLTVPTDHRASSSEDTSPSSSRSGSWIRRSRIFKAL